MIAFSSIFSKFKTSIKDDILKILEREFIEETNKHKLPNQIEDKFLIIRHLIPEQFIIYPLFSLHKKSGLVFRYPGHKKKLLQYAKSKHTKLKKNKHKKNGIDPQIKSFLISLTQNTENSQDLLIFDGDSLKNSDSLFERLDAFSSIRKTDFNFPLEYIY